MAKQVKPLKEMLDLRTRLSDLRGSLQGNDKLEELLLEAVGNTEKLDKLKGEIGSPEKEGPMAEAVANRKARLSRQASRSRGIEPARPDCRAGPVWQRMSAPRERGKDLVKEFVAQVLEGSMTVAKDAEMMINARIAQIDHLLSLQLNEILHHPQFQKLEGSLARAEVPDGSTARPAMG